MSTTGDEPEDPILGFQPTPDDRLPEEKAALSALFDLMIGDGEQPNWLRKYAPFFIVGGRLVISAAGQIFEVRIKLIDSDDDPAVKLVQMFELCDDEDEGPLEGEEPD
jgi:hypothetical protein